MAGFNLGLGASDWLKMKSPNPTIMPIGTGPTAPTAKSTTPAPIPGSLSTPYSSGTQSPIASGAAAGASTGFNWSLPPAGAQTKDPVSGLPMQPAGTPKTTIAAPAVPIPQAQTVPQADKTTIAAPAAPIPQAQTVPQTDKTQVAAPIASTPQAQTAPAADKTQVAAPSTPPPPAQTDTSTAAASATPPAPPAATSSALDDNMATYEKIAMDFANGVVDDKVFKTTTNNAIMQMGLNNQSERDALQMKINQDPSLAGQGAGTALLSMMAAKQNFSADQMFGQLAQDAQQKILDLQKYGLEQGVAINAQRQRDAYTKIAALQDAGDFAGANDLLAQTTGQPRGSLSDTGSTAARTRMASDISTLLQTGDVNAAADKIATLTGTRPDPAELAKRDPTLWTRASDLATAGDYEGAAKAYAAVGVNVTADDLRAQSPLQQASWGKMLDNIKSQALSDPTGAEAQLNALVQNPQAAKFLGLTGADAHSMVQSFVNGTYQTQLNLVQSLSSEINMQANSKVPFAEVLQNYKAMGPAAIQGYENAGKDLAKQDLTSFNKTRTDAGLAAVHTDANGNIVDDAVPPNALTEEDFAETAMRADYQRKATQVAEQPWQTAYDALVAPGSAFASKILSVPGGEQTVKEVLQSQYLGGSYKLDPTTQQMVPDYSGGLPWDNPKTSYLFNNWPMATFDSSGTATNYDLGGEPYGLTQGSTTIQKMPDDQALDASYAKYQYGLGTTGTPLTAQQWYFATAGGKNPPDPTKIPKEIQSPEDLTKVGLPGSTTGTTSTTPAASTQPGTTGALTAANTQVDTMIASLPSSVNADDVKGTLDATSKQTFSDQDYINLMDSNYPGYTEHVMGGQKLAVLNGGQGAWGASPDQIGKDFMGFDRLLKNGLTEKQAASLLETTIGVDRFKAAYKGMTGKEWIDSTMDPTTAGNWGAGLNVTGIGKAPA